jgi:hypothetical protein
VIYLAQLWAKNEKADLSGAERGAIAKVAQELQELHAKQR